jgi:capsule assembly protein Wzi/PAP2 superfamily protein
MASQQSVIHLGFLFLFFCAAGTSDQVAAQGAPQAQSDSLQGNSSDPRKSTASVEASTDCGKTSEADGSRENGVGLPLLRNIFSDQKAIWTSPTKVRFENAEWLVPIAGVTAGFIVSDRDANLHLSHSPTTLQHYTDLSNYGLAGMAGAAGGLYLWGKTTSDPHKQEAGLLSGETALDGFFFSTAIKYATGRERPTFDSSRGKFWQAGDSFPSDHATVAWAIASVLTHEYPGPFTKFLAYGAATAISASRVQGQKHFPSDVLIGSAAGWLIGWQTYRAHHNPEVGGGTVENLTNKPAAETDRTPRAMGSPYVPIDSWIYPLFDRLIALGIINDAILGMRPWTRLECARMVDDAGDRLQDADANSEPAKLQSALALEFSHELALRGGGNNRNLRLESAYTRLTQISGPPLTDGYHFGQTIYNDFGRPFQQGLNSIAGFSGWATSGRWVVYARGEYQHAPGGPANSAAAQAVIAAVDVTPLAPPTPIASRDQARLLDAYVGLNLGNWQLSYGQESQWWGPGESGPLLFSDNASPVRMFHVDRVSPFVLPSFLKIFGPMRWNAYFGQLQGHRISPNPYFHGEKISFKPTPNLEFGFTRNAVVGGGGRPFTLGRLFQTYFNAGSSNNKNPVTDPGKRDGGFDFSYRVPYLRKWLTIYNDSISADNPSPLASPRRAGISPGFYIPQFPFLPKLDLRVEAPLTDSVSHNTSGQYIYWDNFYRDLYTNRQFLMGNWVGRDGAGIQAWSRYWLSPRTSLQFGYRHEKVDVKFIPQGGTINDGSVRADFWPKQDCSVSAFVQYEQWRFPLLASGLQKNVTASLQFTYWPEHHH